MTDKSKMTNKKLLRKGDHFSEEALSDKIGSDLKQLYDDVLNEAVPDDFLALLEKADQQNSEA